ncbi:hypothetical protein ACQKGC_23895 [Allorhizobium pseudoryzae]|uniref:hypothetical protein n=1 Tax=Allorhizobium pseudoryzae TaxID=379684 RepID=UPI003D073097
MGVDVAARTGFADAADDPFAGVDLSLFATFDSEGPPGGSALSGHVVTEAKTVLLELKSADAAASADELRLLLNEMTREMRAQFIAFRDLRSAAEQLAAGGDEAAQKQARADLKAATDAMSLIVRTLEKVDNLQRQLARDRAEEAEKRAEDTGFEEALRHVQELIEARATELFRRWQAAGGDGGSGGGGRAGQVARDGPGSGVGDGSGPEPGDASGYNGLPRDAADGCFAGGAVDSGSGAAGAGPLLGHA